MNRWAGYILAALGFVAYGAFTEADRDDTGAIVDAGTIDAFQIRVGDCFDDTGMGDGEISSLPGVPCADPHDNEAYAVFNIKSASFPGNDEVSEIAYDSCMERFDGFVGKDYQSSSLEMFPIYPTAESWAQDDREVICAVYDMNEGKLQGSVKGLSM
jgi:hypothetical protein